MDAVSDDIIGFLFRNIGTNVENGTDSTWESTVVTITSKANVRTVYTWVGRMGDCGYRRKRF